MHHATRFTVGLVGLLGVSTACSNPTIPGIDAHDNDSGADTLASDGRTDGSVTGLDGAADAAPADASSTPDGSADLVDSASAADAAGPAPCLEGATSGDIAMYGFTRQCSGSIHSYNSTLHPVWNNLLSGFLSGDYPGGSAQFGFPVAATLYGPTRYASFWFNSGATPQGLQIQANPSYGYEALLSVSTTPGDFFGGTSICNGSTLNISSRSATHANCALAPSTGYYLNFALVDLFVPHASTCTTPPCTAAWTVYVYSN